MPGPWRVAKSLLVLRDQLNAAYPQRNKASDGFIGDAAHAKTVSDHNPDANGIVMAGDFTHDPKNGIDIDKITDILVASRDRRIKYIIANGLILDTRPGKNPWKWMAYHGANQHRQHMHISVMANACDVATPWVIKTPAPATKPVQPAQPKPPEITMDEASATYIRQAPDVSIASIPGGTLNKSLAWWISAIYSHINNAEADIRSLHTKIDELREVILMDSTGDDTP